MFRIKYAVSGTTENGVTPIRRIDYSRRLDVCFWWISRRLGGRIVFGGGYWKRPANAGFSLLRWHV